MSSTSNQHTLFNPESHYGLCRAEFDPSEKVFCYFLSLVIEQEFDRHSASVTLNSDAKEKSIVFAPVEKLDLAAGAPILKRDSSVKIIHLDPDQVQLSGEELTISLHCEGVSERHFRILLLSRAARERLRHTAAVPETCEPLEELEGILSSDAIRDNREHARLIASLPELDGIADTEGNCHVSARVPAESPNIDADTWVVCIVDTSAPTNDD